MVKTFLSKTTKSIFFLGFLGSLFFFASCGKKDVKADETVSTPAPSTTTTETTDVDEKNDLITVHFDFDKAAITAAAKKDLRANVQWLKSHPKVTVKVEGNCDERGSDEYNMKLGKRRADAVRQFLVHRGIKPRRITVESFGKDHPVDLGHDEAAWAANRRAAFRITSN